MTTKPHAGMPPLDASADKTSLFEFWPMALFYFPVVLYIGWLILRFRGLMLPTASNPDLPFSGLVGESKTEVLNQVDGDARDWVAAYARVRRTGRDETVAKLDAARAELGLDYPVVLKPDIGMRGAGVQVAKTPDMLKAYVDAFPEGADIVLQYLIPYEGEAGLFYVREPGAKHGRITSLTLKYFPVVTGDGEKTLRQLILETPRAGKLFHLYAERFAGALDAPVEAGKTMRLAFAGNHSKGTIFRNGNAYINDALTERFDALARSVGEFYIGRFDVRFRDWDSFLRGENFQILEINGAGGESTHIWDSRTGLFEAWGVVMQQYRWIYQFGAINRARGFACSKPGELYKAWRHELAISKNYPTTH